MGDGEGAAQHGGEAALEFVGGGLIGWGVAEDYDFVWEVCVAGGVGDRGVAEPALRLRFRLEHAMAAATEREDEAEMSSESHVVLGWLLRVSPTVKPYA